MSNHAERQPLEALLGRARALALATEPLPLVLLGATGEILWASDAAETLFGGDAGSPALIASAAPGLQRLRAHVREGAPGTLAEPLRFFVRGRLEPLFTRARSTRLAGGERALLVQFGDGPAFELPAQAPPVLAPVSPVPPVARPVAAAADRPVSSAPAGRVQRFVFLTDADGVIVSISPAFIQATGTAGDDWIGQGFADVIAGADPVRAAEIARAMHSGATFSAVAVEWPLADGGTLPVEFSAMPAFAADRALSGYNGFGLIRSRREPAVLAEPEPVVPASEADDYEGAVERLEALLGSDAAVEPVIDRDGTLGHQLTTRAEADEAPAAIAPEQPEAPAPAVQPAAPPERTPPAARQDNEAEEPAVVPLHTLRARIGATLGEKKVVPLKPQAPVAQEGARLSNSERNAFREIAKALGARLEDVEDVEPPAEPAPAPVAPNRVAAAQAEISRALAASGTPDGVSAGSLSEVLVDRLPVGVLVFRGDRPIYLNRALLDLTGYADLAEFDALRGLEKLFRGRSMPGLVHGDFDTVTIMGRDGGTLPVDAHLQSIDWKGEPATLVTFRRAVEAENGPRARTLDMELKKRQAELAETRAMLDTATDGVISLDDGGRILALNKSAEALFGYDQNELTGERLTLLLAPESHAAALDYLDGLKTGGVASVLNDGREVIGRERKGGRIPLFMTIGRISDTAKFAAVVRDLTAWKRAETELTEAKRAAERSSALKSDFLAKVSHEIRTPMNAIIGFAEVMRDERLGPIGTERYKDYLKDIHTSGEHVISLVNDLLDLSKIEAGRMELSFGSVDLNAVVTSCLGIMQPQANRDRVIMRSQLSAKLPPVVADERSVRQIILNLLSNASKFTEAGGQVIVSTALSEQGEAVIRVRDTGVGMTEQEIQAAMEPFRQLSNARGRGGTGLGLPLTKALVEANRANFAIKSKVREGTLVEITFPPTRVLAE
jgi:PAS domain S-box-containing protein